MKSFDMRTTNNPMPASTAEISEAMELADSSCTTELYNFTAIARMAIWAYENAPIHERQKFDPHYEVYNADDLILTYEQRQQLADFRTRYGADEKISYEEFKDFVAALDFDHAPVDRPQFVDPLGAEVEDFITGNRTPTTAETLEADAEMQRRREYANYVDNLAHKIFSHIGETVGPENLDLMHELNSFLHGWVKRFN